MSWWPVREVANAGAAAQSASAIPRASGFLMASSSSFRRRSFLQQLEQVIGRFLVAHDGEFLHRLALQLRVLFRAGDLDEGMGVVLDEEAVDRRASQGGVLLAPVDRYERASGLLPPHDAELPDHLAAQLRARLGAQELEDVIAVPGDEHSLQDRL